MNNHDGLNTNINNNNNEDNDALSVDKKVQSNLLQNDSLSSDNLMQSKEEIIKEISLYGEDFKVTKKTEESKVHVEKKWIESTKKIEVPIKYQEIYINGKEFSSMKENELAEVFSKIKEKFSEVFHHGDNKQSKDDNQNNNNNINGKNESKDVDKYSEDLDIKYRDGKEIIMEKEKEKGKNTFLNESLVPLFPNTEANKQINNSNNDEKVIPLWGEEVIVSKKMVKLGEIVIKKYRVNEIRKIDVEVRHEKLTAKYPHDTVEIS